MNDKKFAYQFSILMLVLSIIMFFYFKNYIYFFTFFFLSAIFFIGGFFRLNFISIFKKFWFKLSLILSKFISPIILSVIYFFIVFPTKIAKIILIFFSREKNTKHPSSYWRDIDNFKIDFREMS